MRLLKPLPLGLQDFAEIIRGGYLYVDKTSHIKRMTLSKFNFLSRPRRFGKTLLVNTLEALYKGHRELFQGLAIADQWEWDPRPVVKLNFLGINSQTSEQLDHGISDLLAEQAERYEVLLQSTDCITRFRELIKTLSQKGKVVVLIDEYDKPILDQIHNTEQSETNRDFLARFYAILKEQEPQIEFLLLTGVSKFSQVSIFSNLNNLNDLTLHPAFAALTGYTDEEVDHYLGPYLKEFETEPQEKLRQKIRTWYNGYSWDGKTRLYNPVSLMQMIDRHKFSNYWFSTGTPTFLIKTLRKEAITLNHLLDLQISEESMGGFDPTHISPIELLFQTGYLTIRKADTTEFGTRFTMAFPNYEVKRSFETFLLADYMGTTPTQLSDLGRRLVNKLKSGDIDGFCDGFRGIFATIPYSIFLKDKEAYYHTVIYLVLSLLDVKLVSEIQTNQGRIDAVLETEDTFFVLEFKKGPAYRAMEQIEQKDYAVPYRNRGKEVILIGVGFDEEERNLKDWLYIKDDQPT